MGAPVMGGDNFNVLVTVAAVELVFDPKVGKVHPVVEVRQVVFSRPVFDLALVAIGPAVAVRAAAVVLLEKQRDQHAPPRKAGRRLPCTQEDVPESALAK